MKIYADKKEGFKPVTLSITMENLDELCTIYAIFNFMPIINFIENYCGRNITQEARKSLYIDGDWPPYQKFHTELDNLFGGVR